jgi:small subunit ribosomal protein S16
MLTLRLSRLGRKNKPLFRVIAVDKMKDPWGAFLEKLGNYNPQTKEATLDVERIKYWIGLGAQPSKTLHNLLITKGIIDGKKVGVSKLSKKRREKIDKEKAKKAAVEAKAPADEVTPPEQA